MLYNIHNQLKTKKPCQNIGMRGCRLCPIKGFPPFPKVDNVLFCKNLAIFSEINPIFGAKYIKSHIVLLL